MWCLLTDPNVILLAILCSSSFASASLSNSAAEGDLGGEAAEFDRAPPTSSNVTPPQDPAFIVLLDILGVAFDLPKNFSDASPSWKRWMKIKKYLKATPSTRFRFMFVNPVKLRIILKLLIILLR